MLRITVNHDMDRLEIKSPEADTATYQIKDTMTWQKALDEIFNRLGYDITSRPLNVELINQDEGELHTVGDW